MRINGFCIFNFFIFFEMDRTEFKITNGRAFIETFDNKKFIITVCHEEPRYKNDELFCYYTHCYTIFIGTFSHLKMKQYRYSSKIYFDDDDNIDDVINYIKNMFKY